jgi:MFS family permease
LAANMPQVEAGAPQGLLSRLRSEFGFVQGNFLIMVLSWLVLDFFTELPNTYYTLYVEALGASTTTIGLIFAAQNVASALVQFPGGYLADKYGRKWLISTMTFVAALARIFFVTRPAGSGFSWAPSYAGSRPYTSPPSTR